MRQSGQSLIETIVAIFILTTALSGSIGLAVYAFSNSAISQNEIIATNLAREGIEVVRSMRDSNWLAGDVSSDASFNLQSCSDIGGRACYPNVYAGPTYVLDEGQHQVKLDTSTGTWSIENVPSPADYRLFLQTDGSYTSDPNGLSSFSRMIDFVKNTAAPYTPNNPALIVKSVVVWNAKNCPVIPASVDLLSFNTSCRLVVEEHLTNWKDYR
jgi:type II secretory pathway pseudopilin PulG